MTAPKQGKHPGRAERLAAALKANLKRRKAQARGRIAAGDDRPHQEPAAPSADRRPGLKGGPDR